MMTGTKIRLLAAARRRYVEVEIEELDATFRLQSLNGREMSRFATKFSNGEVDGSSIDQLCELLAMTLVDTEDELMIKTDEEKLLLADLEFSILVKLANAAQLHNRLTDDADKVIAKN